MFYAAVFNDRQVSFSYSTRESLERHNAYRLKDLHSVVSVSSKEDMDQAIKQALRSLSCTKR